MKPKFGSGLLFNSINTTANKQINGLGLINIFRVWAFPCFRNATAVISIFNLSKGTTTGKLFLTTSKRAEMRAIGDFKVVTDRNNTTLAVTPTLTLEFASGGFYFIRAVLDNYKSTLNIPFSVILQKWPEFTQEERQFAQERELPARTIRADLNCPECKHAYIFQESIFEDIQLPGGVLRFPESGEYVCTECSAPIYLRDIQGQIRFSLKEILLNAMKVK
ncbi:hypothetical protein ACFLVY_00795 [Chloroflexota bacterium]